MTHTPAPGFEKLSGLIAKLHKAFEKGRPATWTDRYKFLMAGAGFPLRDEWFVYSCRRGGPYVNPLNPVSFINQLRPRPLTPNEIRFLGGTNLHMTAAFHEALAGRLTIRGLPQNSWFNDKEPGFTVGGPSALVSLMEGSIIGEATFRIHVATLGKMCLDSAAPNFRLKELKARLGVATCEQEAEIIRETLANLGITNIPVVVDMVGYYNHVYERCLDIILGAKVHASRIAEGGLRSATCPENHLIAVAAAKAAGWKATSNVFLAQLLGMRPVGTTGHEHTQRCGSDLAAYESAVDRCTGDVTMLLDTFSTLKSGLPTALHVMQNRPDRRLSVRPDCEPTMEGDFMAIINAFQQAGLTNAGIRLSGGFDGQKTRRFEEIREFLRVDPERVTYLYGEYTLKPHIPLPTRSEASAVFKLCESAGRATMKFSDGPDGKPGPKSSKPGQPVVFRLRSPGGARFSNHPMGIIGQYGERPPDGYQWLDVSRRRRGGHGTLDHYRKFPSPDSSRTKALVTRCTEERKSVIISTLERS